jgi:lipopolysaccharide/colanic/teichoic acid biosynthesis glycosyltransferase
VTTIPHLHQLPYRLAHPALQEPTERVLTAESMRPGGARRVLDIVVAGTGLVLATPLLAVAALLVLLVDGRPVTFRQQRLGEGASPFWLLKLRTMRSTEVPGAEVTTTTDVRITRLGRLLRRTSVDELPQLWHVLRGEMTLVGPRPESVQLASRYPLSCRVVLDARPGLTGPAQLAYRERSAVPPEGWDVESWYLTVLVPLRTQADLEFLARPTVGSTLRWLVRTARFVTGLGDYQRPVTADEPSCTTRESHRALTQAPVVRSNSKL